MLFCFQHDDHPILKDIVAHVEIGISSFQMALRDVVMLPQGVCFHVPPFESLVVQSYPQLQASFANYLHQQFPSSRLSFEYHMSMFLLMCGSRGRYFVLVCPTTLAFCLSSTHFYTTLRTCLGLSHLIVGHLSWCQCGHTIDDLGTHLP